MSLEEDGIEFIWTSEKINSTYRGLVRRGFDPREAGNIVARLMGLQPLEKGWTPNQLKQLMFLRYIDQIKNIEFSAPIA